MIEQKEGVIISIGSDAGHMGEFREGVYSGCKIAFIGVSKAIVREAGRYGVRPKVGCSGVVFPEDKETGEQSMWKGELGDIFTPDVQERAAKGYALRRLGKAEETANAVVFLASDAANYITGQTLSVSSGYSMM